MKLAESGIRIFFDNTSKMLNTLSEHPYVRAADESIHSYRKDTKSVTSSDIIRSDTEAKIALLFKTIDIGFPEYLEVYMGTKWSGFVSSFEGEMSAGYDPCDRIWYRTGTDAQGQVAITDAFYSVDLDAVSIGLVKSVYADDSRTFIGNIAIELTLGTLTDMISKFQIGTTGYVLLMQNDGTILADPIHPEYNFKKITDTDLPNPQQFMNLTEGNIKIKKRRRKLACPNIHDTESGLEINRLCERSRSAERILYYPPVYDCDRYYLISNLYRYTVIACAPHYTAD